MQGLHVVTIKLFSSSTFLVPNIHTEVKIYAYNFFWSFVWTISTDVLIIVSDHLYISFGILHPAHHCTVHQDFSVGYHDGYAKMHLDAHVAIK